ncbi:MAG: hypothetical protein ACQERT_15245 [Thermodesulfobacteriota bacterium]
MISHSCDLAHHDLSGEPNAEILVAEFVHAEDGNFTHGKHPRKLHLKMYGPGQNIQVLEFVPWRRVFVDRLALFKDEPDHERYLLREDIQALTAWMAQRYQRAAFPDAFNNTIRSVGKKPNRIYARLSPTVSGLYARIYPDRELERGEQYSLDLMALIPDQKHTELENVREEIEKLANMFSKSGLDTRAVVHTEGSISFSAVRKMRRFPLEYLSFRNTPHDPLPPVI